MLTFGAQCHPDHIGNLMTNGEATFANAEIIYGRTEFEFWQLGERVSDMRKPTLSLLQSMMLNDTVAHYVASFARPDWHFSMDDDPAAAAISRQRFLDRVATDHIPITGFHMPFPSLGHVEAMENGFRFHPATYQFNL